jgi:hypothetical protein
MRVSVLDIAAALLDGVDGDERARSAAGVLSRRRLLPGVPHLLRADLGAGARGGRERARAQGDAAATLALFGSAAVVALWLPIVGLAICIGCLIGYLRPEP